MSTQSEGSPALFTRKATGLVREAKTRDALFYNLLWSSVALTFAFYWLFFAFYPGANPYVGILIAAGLGLPGSFLYAMLTQIMPRTGGDYVFNSRALHPSIGFAGNFSYCFWLAIVIGVYTTYFAAYGMGAWGRMMAGFTGSSGWMSFGDWFSTEWGLFITGTVALLLSAALFIRGGTRLFFKVQAVGFFIYLAGAFLVPILVGLFQSESGFVSAFNDYAANLGVLTSLADADTVIYSDALNHASIVDGTRLARARVEIVTHADLDALAQALAAHPPERAALVVTDTVFSMDGDVADVAALAALCRDAGALLVLDEAHAVLGPELPESLRHAPDIVRVGTLSKTLGAIGGFVAASSQIVDLLVNTARPFIFTTAPSLPDTAAAHAALDIVRGDEGTALVGRLRAAVDRFVPGHPSPILPVVIGDERDALAAAQSLLDRGCLVPAIRPPTVAAGTSRLRIALSAAHTDEQLAQLHRALDALGLAPTPIGAEA